AIFTVSSVFSSACLFIFTDTATAELSTLSLHDALPILDAAEIGSAIQQVRGECVPQCMRRRFQVETRDFEMLVEHPRDAARRQRSEEHTSELQSRENLVCRLLLEKKKKEKQKDERVMIR